MKKRSQRPAPEEKKSKLVSLDISLLRLVVGGDGTTTPPPGSPGNKHY